MALSALLGAAPAFSPSKSAAVSTPSTPTLMSLQLSGGGNFTISLNGSPWLAGGEVRLGSSSSYDGSLVLTGAPTTHGGKDALGAFEATTYSWALSSAKTTAVMTTAFRSYPSAEGTVVFEQSFPSDVPLDAVGAPSPSMGATIADGAGAAKSSEGAATLFPTFVRGDGGPQDELACASYHGVFPQVQACTVPTYAESHQGGVPLVVYNASDAKLPMTIFSPLSTPKAQHMATTATSIGAGVKATATAIPAGWTQTWLLSGALGINAGFQAWGDRVLAFSGKARADPYRDATHATIGYWTDNGGYYHYSTGDGSHQAKNGSYVYNRTYEEVLPEVKASHDAAGVPFGHWQFDSWFYPKDGAVNGGGGGGGVTNWTADPAIFPSGMAAIDAALGGMPMVMHNRQWSPVSDYVHNLSFAWQSGGASELCRGKCPWAVPDDAAAFFAWFFQQQKGWDLTMYEQDWMCTEHAGPC